MDNITLEFLEKFHENPCGFSKLFTNIWFDHDGTPQEIYPKQLLFLNAKNLPHIRVVLKSRQIGFSSAIVAKVVHSAYFKKTPEILIISKTLKQANKTLKRIRSALNSMPEGMQVTFLHETQEMLALSNGVTIYSLSPVPESCRGFTGEIYIDEIGTFDKKIGYELWEAVYPSVTKGYSITVIGTPQGVGNLLHELWTKTLSERAGVHVDFDAWKLAVPWNEVPHVARNIDIIRAGLTPLQFEQEYNLTFLEDSEETYFRREFIESNCYNKLANDFGFINIPFKSYQEDAITEELKNEYSYLKETFSNIYLGWDMAKVQDQSIVTIFGQRIDKPELYQLIGIHQLSGDYLYQTKCISIIAQLLNAKKVGYDNTTIGKLVQEMLGMTKIANRIVPVNFHATTKVPMYANMRIMMSNKQILIPEIHDVDVAVAKGWPPIAAQIFHQLTSLEYNPVNQRLQAKPGEHDDIPSSMLCAIEALRNKKKKSGFSFVTRK